MHYWNTVLREVSNKNSSSHTFLFTNAGRLMDEDNYELSVPVARKETRDLRTYFLGDDYPDLYLTKREAESIFWIVQEYTISETAFKLGLSTRTVEFYVKNLKLKLRCKNKRTLIEKILQTNLLSQLEQDGMTILRH